MVIGHVKHETIRVQPLLNYYWKIFEEQLNKPNSKLLIIGYGFKDTHVNEALKSAKQKHGLQITVINRTARDKIFAELQKHGCNGMIDKYYSKTLLDIFPQKISTNKHPILVEIMESFFETKFY